MLVALRLEELSAAIWWNKNCNILKKLSSLKDFGDKLDKHFMPANRKLIAFCDNGPQGAWAARKYKGHYVLPPEFLKSIVVAGLCREAKQMLKVLGDHSVPGN
ncbi:hypothetical protein C8F04DRAFT_1198763 [Mycena alexandri]|uniref:Uncharacterized protein n=1 Tax=Mycena alexandri TaxID=1745969 RepID=A0AAD6WMX2_9AGAR|nr:hypothetical protein C8F04DRAFT_1198763 [Mycena alexandri]